MGSLSFVGKYGEMVKFKGQEVDLGPSFWLSMFGSIFCLLASAFTAWASYNKANYIDDDDDVDVKDIEHVDHCDFDN